MKRQRLQRERLQLFLLHTQVSSQPEVVLGFTLLCVLYVSVLIPDYLGSAVLLEREEKN